MNDVWPSRLDYDTAPYWEGLKHKTLSLTRCQDCSHWIHPPRACCPKCWSDNIGHDTPTGGWTLYSYIVQPLEPGGPPSVVGWAELTAQEGLYVVAPIEDVTPETVEIGCRLQLDWRPSRNLFLPVFRPEKSA